MVSHVCSFQVVIYSINYSINTMIKKEEENKMWYTTKDTRWKKVLVVGTVMGSSLLGGVITLGYHLTVF